MEILTIAYAAGLVDGEGTITLIKGNSKFRSPVVSMSSTTYELVDFMKSTFGGHISHHKTYKPHHKPSYSWKIGYNRAIWFLELVLPFLKEPEKKRRALLIISSYKNTTIRNGKYSQKMLTSKLAFESEFFHPSTP